MITKLLPVVLVAVSLVGCAKKTDTAITDTAHVSTLSDADVVTRVASDKELLRQALVEASTRGTLVEGVAAAAADSAVAAKMRQALMGPSVTNTASNAKTGHTTAHTGSTASNKDALDRANENLDKANKTVTKTGEVINKAQDVGKKAGDILNGRR
jgi:hypothetical protein